MSFPINQITQYKNSLSLFTRKGLLSTTNLSINNNNTASNNSSNNKKLSFSVPKNENQRLQKTLTVTSGSSNIEDSSVISNITIQQGGTEKLSTSSPFSGLSARASMGDILSVARGAQVKVVQSSQLSVIEGTIVSISKNPAFGDTVPEADILNILDEEDSLVALPLSLVTSIKFMDPQLASDSLRKDRGSFDISHRRSPSAEILTNCCINSTLGTKSRTSIFENIVRKSYRSGDNNGFWRLCNGLPFLKSKCGQDCSGENSSGFSNNLI